MNEEDKVREVINNLEPIRSLTQYPINRIWSMPNKWTFKIKPISELINKYVGNGKGWIDPFAGMYSPAEYTNDLNPDANAKYHLEAYDFAKEIEKHDVELNGCLFDPPYSLTQISRSYKEMGKQYFNAKDRTGSFKDVRDVIAKMIKLNGIVIYFGWNSNAFGKKRGFEIVEILLVAHGSNRNDTIVTVERKVREPNAEVREFEFA